MEKIRINKEQLQNMLVPFKYKSALIYATELNTIDDSFLGLFGFGQNTIFFEDIKNMPDTIEVEIPTSIEELQDFVEAVDFIIYKISLNGNNIFIQDLNVFIPIKYILTPFILFLKNYEKNILEAQRIKNGD
jgi:hypothetical protein